MKKGVFSSLERFFFLYFCQAWLIIQQPIDLWGAWLKIFQVIYTRAMRKSIKFSILSFAALEISTNADSIC